MQQNVGKCDDGPFVDSQGDRSGIRGEVTDSDVALATFAPLLGILADVHGTRLTKIQPPVIIMAIFNRCVFFFDHIELKLMVVTSKRCLRLQIRKRKDIV
ncbi:MAG: hypothetical protein B7Z58_12145 [Acidiphilium sp. 37-64-53]|nr:MAG: hypothetical protein B7Z58_12145 [Acidiphilium sp. 37-64-53]OZB27420.1 MAG: hypothetical protein B7X49_11145 [Acidiphilium sp. 34-64-41]